MSKVPTKSFCLAFLFGVGMLFLLPARINAQLVVTCPPSDSLLVDQFACTATAGFDVTYTSTIVGEVDYDTTGYFEFIVPPGVTQIDVELWGAQGNTNTAGVLGGLGGFVSGSLTVTPGESLYLLVGEGGLNSWYGGWPGGGYAGYSQCVQARGGGGGGHSYIYRSYYDPFLQYWIYEELVHAGGGGGAGGNRISGCGRGTGGGGGGGYYGGGGGAGWPLSNLAPVPTGGTQSSGGIGGVSTYSGAAPYNNGYDGGQGYGGSGGEELQSAQGGTNTAATGGSAGASVGDDGAYLGNFTGQSGAGGCNSTQHLLPPIVSMGNVKSGMGRIRITFPAPIVLSYISGHNDSTPFALGTTTNTVVVTQSGNADTCSFAITVTETDPPYVICPFANTLFLDGNCNAQVDNYIPYVNNYGDICSPITTLSQNPPAGTTVSGFGTETVWIIATDNYQNQDSCSFQVEKIDGSPPVVLTCPDVMFTPDTVDCTPRVYFPDPTFVDNCPGNLTIIASDTSGSEFLVGTTTVVFTAVDAAGYSVDCLFEVTVNFPSIDDLIQVQTTGPCEGDSVYLTAAPGYTGYLWSNNDVSQSTAVANSGTYWVRLSNGPCNARDSIDVSLLPLPTPVITSTPPVLCVSTTYNSYQWLRLGNPIAGATFQCFQPTQSLPHSVRVQGSNGCYGTSPQTTIVGVDPSDGQLGFDAYPNPAMNQLNISMDQPLFSAGSIKVMDMHGRVVIQRDFEQLAGITTLDLSSLSAGTYVVELTSGELFGRRRMMHVE